MAKPLKSLTFPGLEEQYTVPYAVDKAGTTFKVSTAVAAATWVSSLPTIYSGTGEPGTGASANAKNGDIYIKYS